MKLYEVYESENSLYIVFELLEGGQLYDKIKVMLVFIFSPNKNSQQRKSEKWLKDYFKVSEKCIQSLLCIEI